jgi:transcriptional regulator with XRE-family HTH domain
MENDVSESRETQVGQRLRELRKKRGLSLRALARLCGLSINAISRIERGKSSPTVSSLHQLATALKVPITSFFNDGIEQTTILVRKDRGLRSQIRGVMIESLGSGLPNQQIEPFYLTLEPGAESGTEPIEHPGEEFIHCIEGQVEYKVGDTWHHLNAGDNLLFQATQKHQCRNTSDSSAIILLILQAVEDSRIARKKHLEF